MNNWYSEKDSSSAWLPGDNFSADDDDVCRSVIGEIKDWWGPEMGGSKHFDCLSPLRLDMDLKEKPFQPNMHTMQKIPEFSKGVDAPAVPADPFFKLEETTVEVHEATTDDLGNRLITLLLSENAMNIIKTSQKKFSIKAQSTSPTWFVFKLRIYSQASSHIVEFHRCEGDTVAFHQFFDRATALLTGKCNSMHTVCDFTPQFVEDAASLQPFLDIATSSSDPTLLMEVASALANAAVEEQRALELCTREAFIALECMLRTGGYNVLQPLTQLLSGLVMFTKAAPFFADKKFWQALLDVVTVNGTCEELKTKFACVVTSALAFGASEEQVLAVKVASEAKDVGKHVHGIFDEAVRMVGSICPCKFAGESSCITGRSS